MPEIEYFDTDILLDQVAGMEKDCYLDDGEINMNCSLNDISAELWSRIKSFKGQLEAKDAKLKILRTKLTKIKECIDG